MFAPDLFLVHIKQRPVGFNWCGFCCLLAAPWNGDFDHTARKCKPFFLQDYPSKQNCDIAAFFFSTCPAEELCSTIFAAVSVPCRPHARIAFDLMWSRKHGSMSYRLYNSHLIFGSVCSSSCSALFHIAMTLWGGFAVDSFKRYIDSASDTITHARVA